MRKRVFGSIFLTAIVTLLLTAGLFLLVVHAGLTRDLRGRLAREGGISPLLSPPTATWRRSKRSVRCARTASPS